MQPLENTLLLQSAGRNAKHLPSLRSSEASRRTHTTALTGFTALIEVVSLDPVGQFRANWRDANNRARSYRLTWMRPATRFSRGGIPVSATFKIGDHVRWNSEAGPVTGKIILVHKKDTDFKGYTHHARADDPQYEIKSDKTDHVAIHKGTALHKIE